LPVFNGETPVLQALKSDSSSSVQPAAKVEKTETGPPETAAGLPSDTLAMPAETPRKTRRLADHLSTPSISGMLQGEQAGEAAEPGQASLRSMGSLKNQVFSQEQLIVSWRAFADSVEAAQLKSALSVRDPQLLDNSQIEYNLDNEVQKQRIILDLKPKLLAHLHRTLHNERIDIEFRVTENTEEIMNKPYTDQEKFNTLAAKYPVLLTLKQRFGLDFE
jgi:hypothetical protein